MIRIYVRDPDIIGSGGALGVPAIERASQNELLERAQ